VTRKPEMLPATTNTTTSPSKQHTRGGTVSVLRLAPFPPVRGTEGTDACVTVTDTRRLYVRPPGGHGARPCDQGFVVTQHTGTGEFGEPTAWVELHPLCDPTSRIGRVDPAGIATLVSAAQRSRHWADTRFRLEYTPPPSTVAKNKQQRRGDPDGVWTLVSLADATPLVFGFSKRLQDLDDADRQADGLDRHAGRDGRRRSIGAASSSFGGRASTAASGASIAPELRTALTLTLVLGDLPHAMADALAAAGAPMPTPLPGVTTGAKAAASHAAVRAASEARDAACAKALERRLHRSKPKNNKDTALLGSYLQNVTRGRATAVPRIAAIVSGGGWRAMASAVHFFDALKAYDVTPVVHTVAGLSGGAWATVLSLMVDGGKNQFGSTAFDADTDTPTADAVPSKLVSMLDKAYCERCVPEKVDGGVPQNVMRNAVTAITVVAPVFSRSAHGADTLQRALFNDPTCPKLESFKRLLFRQFLGSADFNKSPDSCVLRARSDGTQPLAFAAANSYTFREPKDAGGYDGYGHPQLWHAFDGLGDCGGGTQYLGGSRVQLDGTLQVKHTPQASTPDAIVNSVVSTATVLAICGSAAAKYHAACKVLDGEGFVGRLVRVPTAGTERHYADLQDAGMDCNLPFPLVTHGVGGCGPADVVLCLEASSDATNAKQLITAIKKQYWRGAIESEDDPVYTSAFDMHEVRVYYPKHPRDPIIVYGIGETWTPTMRMDRTEEELKESRKWVFAVTKGMATLLPAVLDARVEQRAGPAGLGGTAAGRRPAAQPEAAAACEETVRRAASAHAGEALRRVSKAQAAEAQRREAAMQEMEAQAKAREHELQMALEEMRHRMAEERAAETRQAMGAVDGAAQSQGRDAAAIACELQQERERRAAAEAKAAQLAEAVAAARHAADAAARDAETAAAKEAFVSQRSAREREAHASEMRALEEELAEQSAKLAEASHAARAAREREHAAQAMAAEAQEREQAALDALRRQQGGDGSAAATSGDPKPSGVFACDPHALFDSIERSVCKLAPEFSVPHLRGARAPPAREWKWESPLHRHRADRPPGRARAVPGVRPRRPPRGAHGRDLRSHRCLAIKCRGRDGEHARKRGDIVACEAAAAVRNASSSPCACHVLLGLAIHSRAPRCFALGIGARGVGPQGGSHDDLHQFPQRWR